MSYLVLARKYRPHNFETLVGQSHVVQALTNALTQQRLHHAYLFTGTRGVGKTTVSRILAKSLNCTGADGQGGITAKPCGICPACQDIDAGRFVDYIELDAASNRGVEEISQLLDQAAYKPVVGRFKVYMIDEVHMLSNTAFNAMLKTLEEPPQYLKFVLATTDPQKVPATVLSRCLQFNLRPMAPATVQSHLAQVLGDEHIAAEPGALRLLSRAARGSMRDALSLTDQAIAFGAGQLSEAGVRQMLGAVDRHHCVALMAALVDRDGAALVAQCHALQAQGLPAAGTLEELAELCQSAAVVQMAPGALSDGEPAELEAVSRLAAQLPPDELQLFYSMSLHGRAELHLAPDEHSALMMVLLRMLAFRLQGDGSPGLHKAKASDDVPAKTLSAVRSVAAVARMPVVAGPVPVPVHVVASAAPSLAPNPARPRLDEIPPWVDVPPEADDDAVTPSASLLTSDPASMETSTTTAVAVAVAEGRDAVQSLRTPLGDRWAQLVTELVQAERIGALVRELAWTAQCVAVDDASTQWQLRVEREMLRAPSHCDKLQAALSEHLGHPVRLQVEGGPAQDTPAQRQLADKQRRQREAEKIILDDPWVRSVLAQYTTARIVPGSIQHRSISGEAP